MTRRINHSVISRTRVLLFFIIISLILLSTADAFAQFPNSQPRFKKTWVIQFGGSWDHFNMNSLNDHHVYLDYKHIKSGIGLSAEAGHFLSHRIFVSFGAIYLHNRIHGQVETDAYSPDIIRYSFEPSLIAPYLNLRYYFSRMQADYYFGISQIVGFARYSETQESDNRMIVGLGNYLFSAKGIGLGASFGGSKNVNKSLALGTEFGYRFMVTDNLKLRSARYTSVFPVQIQSVFDDANLDFSGPYAAMTLSFLPF